MNQKLIFFKTLPCHLEPYDRENFTDFITQLNDGLNSVELEFRRAQDEVTGVPVIALVTFCQILDQTWRQMVVSLLVL